MGILATVALSEIRENEVALRTVNRESEQYLGLVDSMKQKGFLGAITVREKKDVESGQPYYELVDGLHRFKAAQDAGLNEINVDIVDLNDAETLEAQLMANVHKVETRPVEYTQQLKKILNLNPLMTEAELAEKLGKSPQWIKQRLGLLKIDNPAIQTLIDEGKIGLANAYALARLPAEEMEEYVERAMLQKPDEFVPAVNERLKAIREAKRKGEDAGPVEFVPRAFLQKLADLKKAHADSDLANKMCATHGAQSAVDGFNLALGWVLHLDPGSVEEQRMQDEERKAAKEEAKKRRAKEQADKKAAKAKKAAEEAEEAAKAAAEV
jgi:ParB/RepB/Spo0J family partition protein